MQKDKACRCVTSRMFPHRESKCSKRTNPASTIINVASQASSSVSSMVSPLVQRSIAPTNTAVTAFDVPVGSEFNESNSPLTSPHRSQKHYADSHEEEEMAEALLAIALLESQSQEKNGDTLPHAEFVAATSLAAEADESEIFSTPDRVARETSSTKHAALPVQSPSDIREESFFLEAAQTQPVYAQPCTANSLVYLPMTPQELQEMENFQNRTNVTVLVESPQTQQSTRNNNVQCDCVRSRLFPHRANKCTFRGRTGGVQTEPVASGNVTPVIDRRDDIGVNSSTRTVQALGSTESSNELTIDEGEAAERDESDSTSSNHNSQVNAGSRPCRCVSAAMFPHRANKCTLFNTTNAGKAAVAAGAVQVGRVVTGSNSRRSHDTQRGDEEERRKEKSSELTFGDIHALEVKQRQALRNIPTERLFRSMLHMVGVNITFVCAVSVVLLVSFGLCGHTANWMLRTLGNFILRR